MNIAEAQFPVFNPYNKSTVEIYISGCNKHCPNCHNLELQSFDYGKKLNIEELITYLKEREKFFSIISITGGDLLEQDLESAEMIIYQLVNVFGGKKEFWLFTGATKEEIKYMCNKYNPQIGSITAVNWIFEFFDKIKVGSYKEELKQDGFPASSNQQLLVKGKDY